MAAPALALLVAPPGLSLMRSVRLRRPEKTLAFREARRAIIYRPNAENRLERAANDKTS